MANPEPTKTTNLNRYDANGAMAAEQTLVVLDVYGSAYTFPVVRIDEDEAAHVSAIEDDLLDGSRRWHLAGEGWVRARLGDMSMPMQ